MNVEFSITELKHTIRSKMWVILCFWYIYLSTYMTKSMYNISKMAHILKMKWMLVTMELHNHIHILNTLTLCIGFLGFTRKRWYFLRPTKIVHLENLGILVGVTSEHTISNYYIWFFDFWKINALEPKKNHQFDHSLILCTSQLSFIDSMHFSMLFFISINITLIRLVSL